MLNIHPVIVHTPIGLLTLYSIIELLRFKKLQERPYLFFYQGCFGDCRFWRGSRSLFEWRHD